MKISRKYKAALILSLVVILLVGGMLYVLLKPGRWTGEIVAYLNDSVLEENGWRISIEKIEGQLTSDIDVHNLYLRKTDGSAVFYTDRAEINFNFSQILSGKWAVSKVRSENALVTIDKTSPQAIGEVSFVTDLSRNDFNIQELHLGRSALIVREGENETLYSFRFKGSIDTRDGGLIVTSSEFRFGDLEGKNILQLTGGEFSLSAVDLAAREVTGTLNQVLFDLNSDIGFYPDTKIQLDATVRNIIADRYVTPDVLTVLGADTVDLQVQMETDLVDGIVDGLIYDSRTYGIIGEIDLDVTRQRDQVLMNRAALRVGPSEITAEGKLVNNEAFMLNLFIDKLDLASLQLSPESTLITGTLLLKENLMKRCALKM